MYKILSDYVRFFLLPCFGAFFLVWGLSWSLLPLDESPGGGVAFGIIFAAVSPIVFASLLAGKNFQTRGVILLGGSLLKIIVIFLLVVLVRRQQPPFADKNSFLIWLFLSYLIVSSLGWYVVAVIVPAGGESGGSSHR